MASNLFKTRKLSLNDGDYFFSHYFFYFAEKMKEKKMDVTVDRKIDFPVMKGIFDTFSQLTGRN